MGSNTETIINILHSLLDLEGSIRTLVNHNYTKTYFIKGASYKAIVLPTIATVIVCSCRSYSPLKEIAKSKVKLLLSLALKGKEGKRATTIAVAIVGSRAMTIWEAIQKRNRELIYITYTKI